MALASAQPLTKMRSRNLLGGKGWQARKGDCIEQWSSTWGTRKHPTGYAKIKNIYYFAINNTEQSGPDLGLARGDPDVGIFD
jgi:hypothetical protein